LKLIDIKINFDRPKPHNLLEQQGSCREKCQAQQGKLFQQAVDNTRILVIIFEYQQLQILGESWSYFGDYHLFDNVSATRCT
jgi:hypothetical protein